MPEGCNVVLVFKGTPHPDNMNRRAWCLTHDRFADECAGDPFDTLAHLEEAAKPVPKLVPCFANACQGNFSTAVVPSKVFSVPPEQCKCWKDAHERS